MNLNGGGAGRNGMIHGERGRLFVFVERDCGLLRGLAAGDAHFLELDFCRVQHDL